MPETVVNKSAAHQLAEDYSSTALEYAQLWGPVILPMGLPLLDALPLRDAKRVLDVGTGVGALIPRLRTLVPNAYILGIDFSEGMLRAGRALGHWPLAAMDAGRLALRSESFDAAVLVFMLFHLPDPLPGLLETARVLRNGGSVGLTTWAYEPGLPGATIWTEELDRLGAAPDPRDPSVRQHELMDTPEKVSGLLEAGGFTSIDIWTKRFERRWNRESLLPLQQSCSGSGRRLATLAPAARAKCIARVRRRIAKLPAEELVWTPEVLFAVARVQTAAHLTA
jgi:SAM-dependent methyltransferase